MLQIRLFGAPALEGPAGAHRLERKTAGCLAFLAVEGASARSRVASALWPEVSETTARANLRQVTRRLRLLAKVDALTRTDPLDFSSHTLVDVRKFVTLAAASDWAALSSFRGALLGGFNFDDCPDFADWLELTRTRFNWTLAHALGNQASHVARTRGLPEAIPLTLRWLEVDPVSEEAYRLLMKAHFQLGDRGAALEAFEACRQALRTRLDTDPSVPTQSLADGIRDSSAPPRAGKASHQHEPRSDLLRAPLLAGRRAAWEKLVLGLASGKLLFVRGPAGIGKTRLVQDFVHANADYLHRYIACRPGDRALPYVYFTRTWRDDLTRYPERAAALEPWVRKELARILPELGPAPPPLVSDADRLRFFEANLELAKTNDGPVIVVTDDSHLLDPASHDLGIYLGMYFINKQSRLRSISCYRSEELDEPTRAQIDSVCEAGQGLALDLLPLEEADLDELIRGLDVPPNITAAELLHLTGGIPFFVLETLSAVYESGSPDSALAGASPSDRVQLMLSRRIERLSPEARKLLHFSAVLDEPLRFPLASALVGRNRLSAAWDELERGLLLRNGVVAHELLRSVVLSTLNSPERETCHHQVATALEAAGAHPGKTAVHYLEGGALASAAKCFDRAAAVSRGMLRMAEAEEFERRARDAREGLGFAS